MTAPFAFRVSDAVLGTFGFRIVLVQREDHGALFPIKSVPFYSSKLMKPLSASFSESSGRDEPVRLLSCVQKVINSDGAGALARDDT
jgi:hypothetical protein